MKRKEKKRKEKKRKEKKRKHTSVVGRPSENFSPSLLERESASFSPSSCASHLYNTHVSLISKIKLSVKPPCITPKYTSLHLRLTSSSQVKHLATSQSAISSFLSFMQKRGVMEAILKKYNLKPEEAVFLGDDLIDIPVLRMVGLGVCPSDAPEEVKKEADYISPYAGGKGVLREVTEAVLKARGYWESCRQELH